MVLTALRRKQGRKVSFKSRKRIFINVNSHFNSSETNNLNTSNSDNVILNSNLPRISVHTKSSLNKLITLKNKPIQSQLLVSMVK